MHAAARLLLHMPPAVGDDFGAGDGVDAAAAAQIALPSRHGGLGLRVISVHEAEAAGLSAAALTQAAVEGAHPSFHLTTSSVPAIAGTWERIFDNAAGMWPAASSALAPAIVHDMQRHDHLVMTWRRTMAMQVCARLLSRT
jgi:hypothetical protein